MRLVECVPNFSEGRRPEIVTAIADSIAAVETACVLDTHIDPDHNRSVITFVGTPEQIVTAAVRAVAKAAELIDMRIHRGEHPRLGATDVLPFVPIQQVTIEECVRLAHEAGERIAAELAIPVTSMNKLLVVLTERTLRTFAVARSNCCANRS